MEKAVMCMREGERTSLWTSAKINRLFFTTTNSLRVVSRHFRRSYLKANKCIGDDTKAAACQSVNCIKNKKYVEKRFSICRMEFSHRAMWQDHNIDFARWLHPAVWHVALESWQWIHQVAAPCNVTCGCGMTCHWIRPNVHHIRIIHMVSISTHHRSRHVILYQSAKFYPNRTTLGRKKWRHVDFQDGGSHLGLQGSNNGFFKTPVKLT